MTAGGGEQSLLGTTTRTDGTTQVTYGGHPRYFYAHEGKGEVKSRNINGFGGLWLVVTTAGEAARITVRRAMHADRDRPVSRRGRRP